MFAFIYKFHGIVYSRSIHWAYHGILYYCMFKSHVVFHSITIAIAGMHHSGGMFTNHSYVSVLFSCSDGPRWWGWAGGSLDNHNDSTACLDNSVSSTMNTFAVQ